MGSDADPVTGELNNPMMPIAWTNTYHGARIFTSTIGSADDIETEAVRRMFVNAAYWTVGLEAQIPAKADVAFVGQYRPHSFTSEVYTAGVKPSDLALK